MKGQKYELPNISDVIFWCRTPMDWTCAPHLRHENSRPGHANLQKVHECAQYSKHRLDMEKQTKCNHVEYMSAVHQFHYLVHMLWLYGLL